MSLTWTPEPEPDLASYRVLRDGVEIATVTGAAFTDTGRTNDDAYTYTLVAVDTHGNRSAQSATSTATPRDMAPAPPTGVTATPGDRRAVLGWTAPADAGRRRLPGAGRGRQHRARDGGRAGHQQPS